MHDLATHPTQLDRKGRFAGLIARARAAHPRLVVDDEIFAAFVSTRPSLEDCETHVEDLYLACACATGVAGAAERFEARCMAAVPSVISRIDKAPSFVAEIQQRVREKLVVGTADRQPRIAEYAARGSLVAFVRVAAIREALMERRARGRRQCEEIHELDGIVEGDPTLDIIRREYRGEFQNALRAALAALDRRERSALRMSHLDRLSIDEIGRVFQVHRATAARWIARAEQRVRDLTRAGLQERLHLTDSETDSLMKDLMSVESLSIGMLRSTVSTGA